MVNKKEDFEVKDLAVNDVSVSEVKNDDDELIALPVQNWATEREKIKSKYQELSEVYWYSSIEEMVASMKLKVVSEAMEKMYSEPEAMGGWEWLAAQFALSKAHKILLDYLDSIWQDMGYRERNNQFFIKSHVPKLWADNMF